MTTKAETLNSMPTRQALKVLFVEDSPRDVKLMATMLERAGHLLAFDAVDTPASLWERLGQADHEIIICDYNLRGWTAMRALEIVKKSGKDIPVIVVSGSLGDEAAVECIKQGATDYVLKDRMARLPSAVERALKEKASRDERKQLEEQLQQSQKMESIGRLAGGVAHDFNNLLTVIKGYSQLLSNRLDADNPLQGHVDEIQKAGDRAAALTRQLLAFGRQQVLAPQVLDLSAVVANIDKMLRRLIGEDIELAAIKGEGLGRVKADPGQIEQVIMNLAVNARDAMSKGGKLTIETANLELNEAYADKHLEARPGPYVMLAVSDTGCGMDARTKAHLFEPFFTTKEPGKGTGLGLSTVYGIVKQSGGNIWVYSEPGHGATFKIYLPRVVEAAEAVEQPKAQTQLRRGSETVLLVEDEEAVRSLARRILESNGYTVLEASRPDEARPMLQRHGGPIHLLLTDVVMPGMSGRALAELVCSSRPETKVLYMSGYTDNTIVHHGVLGPGTAFLQKPFTAEALALRVREVLDARH